MLEPDGDTVMISFPDVPSANSFGEDEADALIHGRDALDTMLEWMLELGKPIPLASAPEGRPLVPVSPEARALSMAAGSMGGKAGRIPARLDQAS